MFLKNKSSKLFFSASLVLFILLLMFLEIPRAFACSCISGSGYENSDAVFTGQVINIGYPKPQNNIIGSINSEKVTFNVLQSWKGPNTKNIVIRTAPSEVNCGYEFEKNKEYLVYANKIGNNLEVSLCSRTALLSETQAKEDISSFSSVRVKTFYYILFLLPFLPFIGLGILIFLIYKLIYWFKNKSHGI